MKIGIITGGESREKEISIKSANNLKNILGVPDNLFFNYPAQKQYILESKDSVDVFIPIIHGAGGEDGEVQEFLDSIPIPYIFSSPRPHKTALNKRLSKEVAKNLGINTAREFLPSDNFNEKVFIKPNSEGSSFGVGLVSNKDELEGFLKDHDSRDYILEEFIKGREFSVGVIDINGRTESLPVIEIITGKDFFDYDNKYQKDNLAEEVCPADIEDSLKKDLQNQALSIHQALGCKHVSRSDFIVKENGEIFFIETNTIPGFTETSLIVKEINEADYNIKDLFEHWCKDVLGF